MILEAIKFSNSFFTRNFIRIVFICAIPILFISIFQLTIDPLPWDNLTELSFTTLVFQSFNILFQIAFLSLSILLINDLSNDKSQTIVNYLFKCSFFVLRLNEFLPLLFLIVLTTIKIQEEHLTLDLKTLVSSLLLTLDRQ